MSQRPKAIRKRELEKQLELITKRMLRLGYELPAVKLEPSNTSQSQMAERVAVIATDDKEELQKQYDLVTGRLKEIVQTGHRGRMRKQTIENGLVAWAVLDRNRAPRSWGELNQIMEPYTNSDNPTKQLRRALKSQHGLPTGTLGEFSCSIRKWVEWYFDQPDKKDEARRFLRRKRIDWPKR